MHFKTLMWANCPVLNCSAILVSIVFHQKTICRTFKIYAFFFYRNRCDSLRIFKVGIIFERVHRTKCWSLTPCQPSSHHLNIINISFRCTYLCRIIEINIFYTFASKCSENVVFDHHFLPSFGDISYINMYKTNVF